MDIKATIDKDSFGYRNRLLLIAAGALFWSGYCVYDALIAYPDQIRAYAAITQLKDDHPDDWRERWEEKAKANDWDPTSEPDKRTEGDILTQWLQGRGPVRGRRNRRDRTRCVRTASGLRQATRRATAD